MSKIVKGQTFGLLTVIKDEEINGKRHRCLCQCSCENHTIKYVDKYNLLSGKTSSCGCQIGKKSKARMTTHGKSKTRLYFVWAGMKDRCYNKNHHAYQRYGGRNITVCDEWKDDFLAFEKWAFENGYNENAPHGQCTIDRIDVNKSYSPDNCRWVSLIEQANNTRNTIWITFNGKTQTLLDWAKELNIDSKLLRRRYEDGFNLEEIFSQEHIDRNSQILSFNGEEHSIVEWAKITGISVNTLYTRHRRGWPVDKMLTKNKKGESR